MRKSLYQNLIQTFYLEKLSEMNICFANKAVKLWVAFSYFHGFPFAAGAAIVYVPERGAFFKGIPIDKRKATRQVDRIKRRAFLERAVAELADAFGHGSGFKPAAAGKYLAAELAQVLR